VNASNQEPQPIVIGNWKMNGLRGALAELLSLQSALAGASDLRCEAMICPPATLLMPFAEAVKDSALAIGGQDCHTAASGAHTGDISAEMIADAGGTAVIVGHSERRTDHGEDDALVRAKAEAAWRAGLTAIVCIGETEAERDAGKTLDVLRTQLAGSLPDGLTAANTIVAYEPVWAIGTGRTPSLADIEQAHGAVREALTERFPGEAAGVRVLYGGSVKPGNAGEILPLANVDGALVGGASLKAADFAGILSVYAASPLSV